MARIMLKEVVLGFAKDLFEPTSVMGGPLRYRCTPMIDKGSDNDKLVQAAIREVAKAKFGDKKFEAILNQIAPIPQQYCYKDGDLKDYESSQGRMLLSLTNEDQPTLLDRRRAPAGKDLIYSGAICNVSCDIYAYITENGTKGIAGGIRGVQFVAHGDRLSGGGKASEDEFDNIGGVDDEDDAAADFA